MIWYWLLWLVGFLVLWGLLYVLGAPPVQWVFALAICFAATAFGALAADPIKQKAISRARGRRKGGVGTLAAILDFSIHARGLAMISGALLRGREEKQNSPVPPHTEGLRPEVSVDPKREAPPHQDDARLTAQEPSESVPEAPARPGVRSRSIFYDPHEYINPVAGDREEQPLSRKLN